jgi:uncharacterized membrane protein YfcA
VHLVSITLGVLIGLSLGLLGGGGSILTVPVFVYVLGFGVKESIAMSLAVVGATSLVGALGHWRHGHVKIRVAVVFGAVAMTGTYIGTRLAARLTGGEQLAIFAVVMLLAAGFMLRGRRIDGDGPDRSPDASLPMAITAAEGLAVGSLTGLIGVGGGFVIVPALVLAGLSMRDAVGTSLLTIAMNCAVGFYGYVGQVQIAWMPMLLVIGGTIPGIATGTYASQFVSQRALRRAFGVLLLGIAAYILYRNGPAAF